MKLFDVYPRYNLEIVKANGSYVWDKNGDKYLDLYSGHAVISIGHSHPHYVKMLTEQLNRIGFYSNSIQISQQDELAEKLGKLSGYQDYNLFLCNSGAEAVENALKLASFYNGRKKIIAFTKAFHGRTSLAVSITDNPVIQAPVNKNPNVFMLAFNDEQQFEQTITQHEICAVIVEGIQGIGGIYVPQNSFYDKIQNLCKQTGTLLILDEIQSGYGRTGKFFAHQYENVQPDIITVAKGMGNGFPIGGVLIHPKIEASHGKLGTTFGGNHLACAAGIAVLDVIETENLIDNAAKLGNFLLEKLIQFKHKIKEVRGRGLMIGLEFDHPVSDFRKELLFKHKIFTGFSANKNVIRILPPLNLSMDDAAHFINVLAQVFHETK